MRKPTDDERRALMRLGILPPDGTEHKDRKRLDASELPCRHRSLEPVSEVPCGCGARGKTMPVYSCGELTYCTLQGTGKRNKLHDVSVAICLGCPKRDA